MPSHATIASPPQSPKEEKETTGKTRRWGFVVLVVGFVVLCSGALSLRYWWPFRQEAVIQDLHEATDSDVHVRAFRETFFPPGCVLEGVNFLHGSGAKPLITIERLTVQGSYMGIVLRRVNRVTAQGTKVFIPPFGSEQSFHITRSSVTVEEFDANGATVEFASKKTGTTPLRFDLYEASFRNVAWNAPLGYHLRLHNPNPPGEITANGQFGMWDQGDAGHTPVSGQYKFEHADLSVYSGIAGMLSSEGKFSGTLGHIDISGMTDTPDFEVTMGEHPVRLITEFKAYVDATKGDIFLEQVDAHFRKTHVVAEGSIAKPPKGIGKTALLELRTTNGRIEDLLSLFVKKERPPMSGAITFGAKVEIPPGDRPFLEKVKLQGKFGIGGGQFAKTSVQESVERLSAGARGEKTVEDPRTVLTDLTGQVTLAGGVAHFADLSFGVPGASARMNGTYGLIDHKIDLRGQMQVDTKISKTTNGPKAFLLTVMDPFFKKQKKGEILPVKIAGTYERPTYGLDFRDKKAHAVRLPEPKAH